MKILLALSAGFCFGVSKAVDSVNRLLDEGKTVYTLGPIIHNPQLVAQLESRGVRIVEAPEEAPPGATLVIRSHGVPREIMDRIAARYATPPVPLSGKSTALQRSSPPGAPACLSRAIRIIPRWWGSGAIVPAPPMLYPARRNCGNGSPGVNGRNRLLSR